MGSEEEKIGGFAAGRARLLVVAGGGDGVFVWEDRGHTLVSWLGEVLDEVER